MASRARQPQLRRRLPAGVLVALIVAALADALASEASGYEPPRGDQFFLLSDASVGADGVAVVRLETPAGAPDGHVEGYGGADIVVYRVPDPVAFLKRQPNLHRVEVKGAYEGEGLANTLSHLWSQWNRQARQSWQRLFASGARKAVTTHAPETKAPRGNWTVAYESAPQFAPLKGFELVDRFRYPVWQARPIEPPKQVTLAGSSSEWDWARSSRGNVLVPIGKRAPGLYLVEAIIGAYRATTLVFVSDTVALTKVSAGELLVWTVDRRTGRAVGGVDVAWTDGLGTLQSATTGADGVAVFRHASPERTYVIGRDGDGGVFVSENFYYDSEIYDTKLYAVTDRPLYRPGDTVHVKVLGREFKDARRSQPVVAGPLALTVLDPTGTPVATRALTLSPTSGANTSVELPANSPAGGYRIRLGYRKQVHHAAPRGRAEPLCADAPRERRGRLPGAHDQGDPDRARRHPLHADRAAPLQRARRDGELHDLAGARRPRPARPLGARAPGEPRTGHRPAGRQRAACHGVRGARVLHRLATRRVAPARRGDNALGRPPAARRRARDDRDRARPRALQAGRRGPRADHVLRAGGRGPADARAGSRRAPCAADRGRAVAETRAARRGAMARRDPGATRARAQRDLLRALRARRRLRVPESRAARRAGLGGAGVQDRAGDLSTGGRGEGRGHQHDRRQAGRRAADGLRRRRDDLRAPAGDRARYPRVLLPLAAQQRADVVQPLVHLLRHGVVVIAEPAGAQRRQPTRRQGAGATAA